MWVRVDISGLLFRVVQNSIEDSVAKGDMLFMSPFDTMLSKAVCSKCICKWKKGLFKYHNQIYFFRRNILLFLLLEETNQGSTLIFEQFKLIFPFFTKYSFPFRLLLGLFLSLSFIITTAVILFYRKKIRVYLT